MSAGSTRHFHLKTNLIFWQLVHGSGFRGLSLFSASKWKKPKLAIAHSHSGIYSLRSMSPSYFGILQNAVLIPSHYDICTLISHFVR